MQKTKYLNFFLFEKSVSLFLLFFLTNLSIPLRGTDINELPPSSASVFVNLKYYLFQPIYLLLPCPESRKVIYETKSQYSCIRVELDESGNRRLVFLPDRGSQSIYDPTNPYKIVLSYARYGLLALPALGIEPQQILFIGMGGGIMPMYIRRHFSEARLDIVEIDKVILPIAEKYFDFKKDSKINVFFEDGAKFVRKCQEKYDIIFLDAYNAEGMPIQFTTSIFFAQIKKRLNKNGILSTNIANLGNRTAVTNVLNTIFKTFPKTLLFVSERNTNYIAISFNNDDVSFDNLYKNAINMDNTKQFNINFKEMLSRVIVPKLKAF